MEFFDEDNGRVLHSLAIELTRAEAEEIVEKIRALKGNPTRTQHEIPIGAPGGQVTFFVHPEDPLLS